MKMPTVLALTIVGLCVMECCVSALPIKSNETLKILKILENIEETIDPCPDKWTKFEDSCYHVKSVIMNWPDSKLYCESMHGNLVKINSLKENLFVLDLVRKHASGLAQVWLGFQWKETANPRAYYWYDNSVPTFTYWAPGEANNKAPGYCGQMYVGWRDRPLPQRASGYWSDNLCTNPDHAYVNGVVCKKLI